MCSIGILETISLSANYLSKIKIRLKKIEAIIQSSPQVGYRPPHITNDMAELKAVHRFTYLGYTITSDNKVDKEVDNKQKRTVSGTTDTWRRAQKSACIEPSSLSPFYMAQSHGSHRHRLRLRYSTSTASPRSSSSTGVTSSPILKSINRQRSLVSKRCNWSLSYVGLDMSPGWGIIVCPESYCESTSLLATVTEGHQRSDSRTTWNNLLVHVKSTIANRPLRTVKPGVSPLIKLFPPL